MQTPAGLALQARLFFCAVVISTPVQLLTVGTVAFDRIETPFSSVERVLGGSATYISLAARFMTDNVHLVSVVGKDFPHEYISTLRDRGVQLDGLEVDAIGDTFAWAGRYHYDMNQRDTLETRLNVLMTFNPVVPLAARNARILCLGNLDPKIQMQVLDQMEGPCFSILDTMNYWIEHTPDALADVLKRVDCLIINDAEARELAQTPNLIAAARRIQHMGVHTLVIKKGEHGALLFSHGQVFSAPAYPLETLYDPTGAGDTFMGGFAGYLAQVPEITHDTLKMAVVYGSALASYCVEAFGPNRLLDLTASELYDRVAAFRALCAWPAQHPESLPYR